MKPPFPINKKILIFWPEGDCWVAVETYLWPYQEYLRPGQEQKLDFSSLPGPAMGEDGHIDWQPEDWLEMPERPEK